MTSQMVATPGVSSSTSQSSGLSYNSSGSVGGGGGTGTSNNAGNAGISVPAASRLASVSNSSLLNLIAETITLTSGDIRSGEQLSSAPMRNNDKDFFSSLGFDDLVKLLGQLAVLVCDELGCS